MEYISVFDHITRKRLAFLENASSVGYTMEKNAVWSAKFTLPIEDRKNAFCQPFNFVEIFDEGKRIGLFRIMPSSFSKLMSSRGVTYECEHVLATLIDDVLLGWHEIGNAGVYTTEVLRYVLDRQEVKRWQLGACEFSHQYLYGWENENLLTALFSIPNCFTEDFRWEFDTRTYPWTISLRKSPTKANVDIRYGKNMLGIQKDTDPTNIATRLYPFGYGEGDNQLNIQNVNPTGKKYLDADTQSKYGIISKIWIDQRYEQEQSLYQAAIKMLEELKEPQYTYTVSAAHIGSLTDAEIGDIVRVIDDEESIDIYAPIVKIEKGNVTGAPHECKITIGNKASSIASTIADLSDRQRVQEAYSQGAVTLFTSDFNDNCANGDPAEIRFYIPKNVVHINQILLNGRATPFRGYTKATGGGGERATTTSDGGGSNTTTAAGGGSTATSTAGGGGTYYSTTAAGGGNNITASAGAIGNWTASAGGHWCSAAGYHEVSTYTYFASGTGNHRHQIYQQIGAHNHWIDSHEHYINISGHTHSISIPNHSHSVSIGVSNHSHSVNIPSHSHSFSIPAHNHNISLPEHTHSIEHGIYKGTTASQLKIAVDGNNVGTYGASTGDVNIIPYLSKDKNGNVQRGWHTVTITPDKLTRVSFNLITQLFANSRGGGQY